MAKYSVDFSCGHTAQVELFGPHKARYERIDWLEAKGLCPDCYKASLPRHIMLQWLYKDEDSYNAVLLIGGETYSIKNELKALGFNFTGGLGWHRRVTVSGESEIVSAAIETAEMLKDLGVFVFSATRYMSDPSHVRGLGVNVPIDNDMRNRIKVAYEKKMKSNFNK